MKPRHEASLLNVPKRLKKKTTTAAKQIEALKTNLMMSSNPSPYRLLNLLIPILRNPTKASQ